MTDNITVSRELLRQVLEALEAVNSYPHRHLTPSIAATRVALRAALEQPAVQPEKLGSEWVPCMKLPVVVHVRNQRDGERHVSTREGITPVKPDDLIMRGVSGEEYPIGRAIFDQTYTFDIAAQLAPVQEPEKLNPLTQLQVAYVMGLRDVRKPKENLSEVGSAMSTSFKVLGNRDVPMDSLTGAMSASAGDADRTQKLANTLEQDGSYFERVIVDDAGNVIEGQHRVAALRLLGAKTVPAVVIQDFMRGFDSVAVGSAMRAAQPMPSDRLNNLVANLAEIYADEKGKIDEVRDYEPPRGFEKAWAAGIELLEGQQSAPDTDGAPMFSRTVGEALNAGVNNVKAFDVTGATSDQLAHYRGMGMQVLGRRQIVDLYGDMLPELKAYEPGKLGVFRYEQMGTCVSEFEPVWVGADLDAVVDAAMEAK